MTMSMAMQLPWEKAPVHGVERGKGEAELKVIKAVYGEQKMLILN